MMPPSQPAPTAEIRTYWDEDAGVYDDNAGHYPTDPAVVAAWSQTLAGLLPDPPARVLDVGAGTGFLSLLAARLGHEVTALDVSSKMLERLSAKAADEDLKITTVHAPADTPPEGPFDAVMERHVLWILPDPSAALAAWRESAPDGRLVAIESLWGSADPLGRWGPRARRVVRTLLRDEPAHHAELPAAVRGQLPLGAGTPPARLVDYVFEAGWRHLRLSRLSSIEIAERAGLSRPQRFARTTGRFCVTASAG